MYESLTITVICEGSMADTDLEDVSLAYTDTDALEEQISKISDMDGLIDLISQYCDGYPRNLIKKGKSDWFIDALTPMEFGKLKMLEFNHFTSDFEAPVEDPPLETSTNLTYDFASGKATCEISEC